MKDKVLSRFSSRLLISCFVFLIKIYQKLLSPLTLPSCRYLPTCSQYAVEAFEKYGIIKGFLLTIKRFLSCHPFAQSRVDEVP